MSHSFTKIWIHAIWSAKERVYLIDSELKDTLYENMKNEFAEKGCKVSIMNGIPDHVHCLFQLNPAHAVADVIKHVKGHSSHFVHQHELTVGKFAWQTGYAAFSVSPSVYKKVHAYILNQEKHHIDKTVAEELEGFERLHEKQ